MCNINIVIDKRKKNNRELLQLLNVLTALSFSKNSDGDGCLFLDEKGRQQLQKATKKQIYTAPAYAYLSHQRFKTSGPNEDTYVHPFETEYHYILHNGIFEGYDTAEHSDTFQFSKDFEGVYSLLGDTVQTLKEVLKGQTGDYSIVVVEKKTGRMLYVRNDWRHFYVTYNKEYIIGSTVQENTELGAEHLKMDGAIFEPKSYKIYDIMRGFQVVGKLEKPAYKKHYTVVSGKKYYWTEEEEKEWAEEEDRWQKNIQRNKQNSPYYGDHYGVGTYDKNTGWRY